MARTMQKNARDRRRQRRAHALPPMSSWGRLAQAHGYYVNHCASAAARDFKDDGRVICENCGLEQAYVSGWAMGGGDVFVCPGPLGLGCGHEYAVTTAAWREAA